MKRKAAAQKKAADAQAYLASLIAESTGGSADDLKKEFGSTQGANPTETKQMQLEGALDVLSKPNKYQFKRCKRCLVGFGTTYTFVAYCSDSCRKIHWEEQVKVPWNYMGKPAEEIWNGEPPMVIKPETLDKIKKLAHLLQIAFPEDSATDQPTLFEVAEIPDYSERPQPPKTTVQATPQQEPSEDTILSGLGLTFFSE